MSVMRCTVLVLVVVALGACAGRSGTGLDDGLGGAGGGIDGPDGAAPSGVDRDGVGRGSAFGEDADAVQSLDNRVIYFDFDQADVGADYAELIRLHGEYLAANPTVRVRLEGHADERGSREYNIGLGERRAQAVRQRLLLQGVAAVQLSTVSYGEERPAVLGSDEEAWVLNRRVELVYGR